MRPMKAADIRGNYATLLLPITRSDAIDYGRLREEIDYLVNAGVDGIYSNGTAGEFHTQSEEEFLRICDLLAGACEGADLPFQVGASHMSAQLSLHRIRRAREYRPSAIQVILADWFPLADDEVITCLSRFAEAADPVGIVLYNPPHAKRVLGPEMFGRIAAEVPGVVGIKVAGGDDAWFAAMGPIGRNTSIFVPGHLLASGVSRGAHGAYSNVACLSPVGAQRWYDSMAADPSRALELESRLVRFMTDHIVPFITEEHYCNAACDKLLAAIGDWAPVGTRLRFPYRWIPETEADRLRPIARDLVPEMFAA